MTIQDQTRLAQIHAQFQTWSAVMDTSSWEVAFFFRLLDAKNREIDYWKKQAGPDSSDN